MTQVLTHRWRTINQLAVRPACSKNSIVDAELLCVCVQTMRLRRQRFSVFMRKDDTVGFLVEGILYQQSFGQFECPVHALSCDCQVERGFTKP